MTTLKTSTLTGAALDWAVCRCEGLRHVGNYAKSWRHCGPIIEREGISIGAHLDGEEWFARDYWGMNEQDAENPLIAAMRCYVASKLGDDVDIPSELV